MSTGQQAGRARADWVARIGRRTAGAGGSVDRPPPPAGVRAVAGRGQVTLDWEPVPGVAGYLVHRASTPDGPFAVVDHRGLDVLAVPHPPYADTTGEPGVPAWYAVAALPEAGSRGELSTPDSATPGAVGAAAVSVRVNAGAVRGELARPWRPMVGAEHLSHLLSADRTGGWPIGADLTEALRIVHTELGVRTVRAHGILCDDLGVYREVDGEPVYDFAGVDRVYDQLLALGLRPVVELSFMPRDLATDPSATVFSYGAIISPPRDWGRWVDLIRTFTAHLVDRYGLAEVRDRWSFEVWNEANLEVFWTGGLTDYLRLYEVTARAVKSVHAGLRVGGPSSAAAGWVDELLGHAGDTGAPLDFVSTHTYGSPPLDLRPALARHGRPDAAIWWTEWGVTPQHFNPVNDGVFTAAFTARGMRSAAGRLDALAPWVASDHFEELGRPPQLLHGGFGLLSVGNLRKPKFWALAMLNRLGDRELAVELSGDGAGSLVEAWAGAGAGGRVALALWNGTLDQSKVDGSELLDRAVTVQLTGLTAVAYRLRHYRVDATHSNLAARWASLGSGDWPDEAGWAALRAADRLDELAAPQRVVPRGGTVEIGFDLPMPSVSLLELVPEPS
ncbi:MAG: xylan 1,4-beta-xylosidase [Mycobacteriales bacterium]